MNYHLDFNIDFKRNQYKGLYIALEGIDGAGKTVQTERLATHFRELGKDVLVVNEPRRTGIIGRVINEFLQKRVKLPAASLQYLFSADRIAHQEEVIFPALEKGQIVLSHRCFWSAVPYGIMDRSGEKGSLEVGNVILVAQSILSMYYQIVIPDITFFIDISPETAMKRLNKLGAAREYYENRQKLEKVRDGYNWMLDKFPKEFTVVDGEKEIEDVTEEIISTIEKRK